MNHDSTTDLKYFYYKTTNDYKFNTTNKVTKTITTTRISNTNPKQILLLFAATTASFT